MTELICIVCPKGCRLKVDEENGYVVSGNSCPRGAEYGINELLNPVRTVTSTVAIEGGIHRRLPVKTSRPVPSMQRREPVTAQRSYTKPEAYCVSCELSGEDHFVRDRQRRLAQLDDWLKNGLVDREEYQVLKRRFQNDQ